MAYVHIAAARGMTIDNFRQVAEKLDPPANIAGVLVQAAGSDENGLHVVTVWESKAHLDRYEAEQLFPAFQAVGIASEVAANTAFTIFNADEIYVGA
jgi:heme-degrading monooxygenase HmoA